MSNAMIEVDELMATLLGFDTEKRSEDEIYEMHMTFRDLDG